MAGAVIGIIIGVIVALIVVICICKCCCNKQMKSQRHPTTMTWKQSDRQPEPAMYNPPTSVNNGKFEHFAHNELSLTLSIYLHALRGWKTTMNYMIIQLNCPVRSNLALI